MRTADDPIGLLSDLLRAGERRVVAQARGGRVPAVAALVQAGILVPDGVAQTTICDACDTPHLVEIVPDGLDGGYGWRCPEVGFVAADLDAIATLSIGIGRVVEALSDALTTAFGPRRWKPRPLEGTDAWIVGVWPIGNALTTVVLARGLESTATARRTAEALAGLAQNDAGLVLIVGEDTGFVAPGRFAVVSLTASLMLEAEGRLSVDAKMLEQAVTPHAADRLVAHVGRPSVEAKVFAVLEGLASRGAASSGGGVNAGVVARAWPEFYPGETAPRPSTLRRHIKSYGQR